MRELALDWIGRYGYAGIFFLLVLGIVGLPVPDEWLLTFSGYLVFKHTLQFIPTVLSAFGGTVCGISTSYLLGNTFGTYLLEKHGRWIHVTEARIAALHAGFQRWGTWTLAIGYFIPGVRHLTAYLAGASRLSLRSFALFAYSGALVWSLTFVTTGYLVGEEWSHFSQQVHERLIVGLVGIILIAILWLVAQAVRRRTSY